ncbi:hypothetical protein ACFLW0_04160 [Chloroflexota bacterium]
MLLRKTGSFAIPVILLIGVALISVLLIAMNRGDSMAEKIDTGIQDRSVPKIDMSVTPLTETATFALG